ncbi:DUF4118 domain-containing protein [Phenylobacterium sp.]|uniref:DUF4118 domain-containing protein n=1 Tax=Phenylobacterium sp. TaxID=1871053 RepID=UPI0030F47ABB
MTSPKLKDVKGPWRYLAALGVVMAATLIAELLYRVLETTRLSMIFLAGVLVAAVWLGSGPAYVAAAAAFLIYNFYLVDPRFTLTFGSAEDVIVLAVFLIVAMLTGSLAGRVRDEARRAQDRARTTAALLEASRAFGASIGEEAVRERLATHLAEAAKGEAVIWDGSRALTHPAGVAPPADLIADVEAPADSVLTIAGGDWRARPLRAGDERLGVAAWRPLGPEAPEAEEASLMDVLVDLGAGALVRARLSEGQAEIQALARTEQLRNALLSSISHDLRTPLAAILASASSLKEFGGQFPPEVRDDLLATITEEAERLNLFVANLLDMTKLDGGALQVDSSPFSVREVIDRLTTRLTRRLGARRLVTQMGVGGLIARGDPVLLEQALSNVLENAIRFSPDGSEIAISVQGGASVRIEVTDAGPGVPEAELDLIFEKFYRAAHAAKHSQGTGLGLSIARGLTEAMGGAVNARPRADAPGLVVALRLPGEAAA